MNEQTNRREKTTLTMSDAAYDRLKYLGQIILPALATLYFALSEIWGFPYGPETVGTITAFDAFLGVLLGISSSSYYSGGRRFDGVIEVYEDENTKQFTINVEDDPYVLDQKDSVTFSIQRESR